ncbi:MAG: fumarylacetoacetate hydrolase family protein [Burkholderiales bacterium]|nr:fumarylacetoacetate hydrolase family protein [Burkholderiales bacterium]MCL4690138.1 fumarylacetoacetate hydrolase family protein [Burkholderiales bacterium]
MLGIIRGGAAARKALDALAARPPAAAVAMADVKLHAPIPRPAKNVFCVGWNYLEHFEEGAKKLQDNRELPQWPVFFSKAPTAVNGPFDPIPFDPAISTSLDWEVELGVVIGPGGKDIKAEDAMAHVWGYTVINDVSWRDLQRRHGGQWHKGKSLDGTCPMGPVLVTADSLDHTNLRVTCRVNGVTKQDSNTKFLYFKLPRLIHDLSMGMTLEPGDVISTGTPEGVGFARNPPEFLKPGDLLETEIEGIGTLRNPIGG